MRNHKSIAVSVLALLMMMNLFVACGSKGETWTDSNIGIVTDDGVHFRANIHLMDKAWNELSEEEKKGVINDCIDNVEINSDPAGGYVITGFDGDQNEELFTYNDSDHQASLIDGTKIEIEDRWQ